MTVRAILNAAIFLHGCLAVIYGGAALTHPALLEPLHQAPPPEHVHFFRLHGVTLLLVGLIAIYVSAVVRDRVHTYWLALFMWAWTAAAFYTAYSDQVMHGKQPWDEAPSASATSSAATDGSEREATVTTADSALGHVHAGGPRSTWALVFLLGSLMCIYAAAFIVVTLAPGGGEVHHAGSHVKHHERQAKAAAKQGHAD